MSQHQRDQSSTEQPPAAAQIDLVASLCHELRTPLTTIFGALNLLEASLAETMTERTRNVLGLATQSINRLTDLIDRTHDLSHLESGRAGGLPSRAEADAPLGAAVSRRREDTVARILILDDSLTVRMDLHGVFTEAGYVSVPCGTAAEARQHLAQGGFGLIVLDVQLPDADGLELLASLKAAPETRDVPVLLLSSAADVRRRLKGIEIGADDFVGKPYDTLVLLMRARELLGEALPPSRPAPLVLVVDDSATAREAHREALIAAGYAVSLAASGEEGLRLARMVRPDAVVIDRDMPGLDGGATIQRLRREPSLRLVPCVMLTGTEGGDAERQAFEAGADAYVRKSADPGLLLARLASLLRGAGQAVELPLGPRRVVGLADAPGTLEGLGQALAREGLEFLALADEDEAYRLLAGQRVDGLIVDRVAMPERLATVRRLRACPEGLEIPLVLLGSEEADGAIAGLTAGADDVMARTLGAEAIKDRLLAQLRRKRLVQEQRRLREDELRQAAAEAEARAARELAETRAGLLADLERKNAELEAAKAEAEAATRAQSDFLASMSHEIRTPLTAVVGMAEQLAAGPLAPAQAPCVEVLQRASTDLMMLLNDLLDLSKIEAGQLALDAHPFDMDALLEQAVGVAAWRAQQKQLTLSLQLAPEARGPWIGDALRLGQVFNNLLSNAVKFTETGGITVVARLDEGAVHVEIRDTGIGIPEDRREAIFERFTQAGAATARQYGGTGLGLAISKQLVERMGGRLWVESRVGHGSAFHFTVRLTPGERLEGARPAEPPAAPERGCRILLAEDAADVRAVFALYFEGTPHAVQLVENGQLALDAFTAGGFDLVLLDMQMPVMGGLEAAGAMRRHEAALGLARTPILALTAFALQEETARCLEAGCDGHLAKPIKRSALLEAVAAHAGRRGVV